MRTLTESKQCEDCEQFFPQHYQYRQCDKCGGFLCANCGHECECGHKVCKEHWNEKRKLCTTCVMLFDNKTVEELLDRKVELEQSIVDIHREYKDKIDETAKEIDAINQRLTEIG